MDFDHLSRSSFQGRLAPLAPFRGESCSRRHLLFFGFCWHVSLVRSELRERSHDRRHVLPNNSRSSSIHRLSMSRAPLVFLSLFAVFCLAGCGGIADNVAVHRLTVHTHRAAQPLDVAIHSARDSHSAQENQWQHRVTDASGDASAQFRVMWGGVFLIIPPVGNVPHHPSPPSYVVRVRNRRFEISRGQPNTIYRWKDNQWQTDATIALP